MKMPMGEAPAKTSKSKKVKEKIDPAILTYPTKNRLLQFFGDVMLLIGSLFTNVGLRYGGIYEYEFDEISADIEG